MSIIITIAILISIVFVLRMGQTLCQPAPETLTKPDIGHTLLDADLHKANGDTLKAWYQHGQEDKPVILHFHGNRQNRLQIIQRVKYFADLGYSNLLPDFQAHGESTGEHVTFGYLEAEDTELWLQFAEQQFPHRKIVAIGLSLGGAACLLSKTAEKVDAIILEMVYPTLIEAINNRMTLRFGLLSQFISPLLTAQLKPVLGIWASDLQPIRPIRKLTTPKLIIAGSEDDRTTLEQSQRLFDVAAEPKAFWCVKGAAHEDLHAYAPSAYEKKVGDFIQKWAG